MQPFLLKNGTVGFENWERDEGDRQEADCQLLSSASNWRGRYALQCRTKFKFPEVTETLSLIWTVLKRAGLTSILIGRYIYEFKYSVASENMDLLATSLISFWYSRIFSLFKFYQFIVHWIVLSTRLCNKPSFVQKWILTLCRRAERERKKGELGSCSSPVHRTGEDDMRGTIYIIINLK